MTGTVNAARQGSGGRQKRSPYGLVVLACGSTIYPLKPAQAQTSRGHISNPLGPDRTRVDTRNQRSSPRLVPITVTAIVSRRSSRTVPSLHTRHFLRVVSSQRLNLL